MPALREVQRSFAAGLMSDEVGAIAATILPAGIPAATRLGIYRNTMNLALTGALKLTYPAVEKLAGPAFFEQAVMVFVRAAPPRCALLANYGEGFADFLASYPPLRDMPYFADVARLEWAVEQATRGPLPNEAAPLANVALPGATLSVAPSLTVLRARFPAEAIWRAVIDDDLTALDQIDTRQAAERIAIWRHGDGAAVARLSTTAAKFLDRLFAGDDADTALTIAAEADPTADPIAVITADIFQAGFVQLTPTH